MSEAKVYTFTAKYTKKDGTVSEYPVTRTYISKPKEALKKPILDAVRMMDNKEKLKAIKRLIEYVIAAEDDGLARLLMFVEGK